ncbi:MAG: plastocyanin/azurin family copper-binding protein, partial [Chloroflexota bacterium]|nr:plastocyanin/azurin family copper-binding protein [Chloroflexota bacterium]
ASPVATTGGGPAIACGATAAGATSVTIADFAFEPANAAVAVGGGVTWTHAGDFPHTVTFRDGTDCGRVTSGGTVNAVFNQPGSWDYFCAIHPQMTGTVTVEP